MKNSFKIIGFDADDTLWVNEPLYREAEKQFCELLSDFQTTDIIIDELFKTEMQNIELYGYGAKGFLLSIIETALRISNNRVAQSTIEKIIEIGKGLLNHPIVLLEGVKEVLEKLYDKEFKLIVATKGDLLEQERKLEKSKIEKYFHHIEIMSDKKESDYLKLLSHLNIKPKDFLMIGNSLKSDIIPILNIGGSGIHVPYHTTWQHEETPKLEEVNNFIEIDNISEIIEILKI
jgi:putative hydrolase of the HAD superfamily